MSELEQATGAATEHLLACEDCGLPYRDFPLDVVLPDEHWELIHPSGTGGVLCAACIVSRAAQVPGVTVIHASLNSGTELTAYQVRAGIEAVFAVAARCSVCGMRFDDEAHAEQPHAAETHDLVDAFRRAAREVRPFETLPSEVSDDD